MSDNDKARKDNRERQRLYRRRHYDCKARQDALEARLAALESLQAVLRPMRMDVDTAVRPSSPSTSFPPPTSSHPPPSTPTHESLCPAAPMPQPASSRLTESTRPTTPPLHPAPVTSSTALPRPHEGWSVDDVPNSAESSIPDTPSPYDAKPTPRTAKRQRAVTQPRVNGRFVATTIKSRRR